MKFQRIIKSIDRFLVRHLHLNASKAQAIVEKDSSINIIRQVCGDRFQEIIPFKNLTTSKINISNIKDYEKALGLLFAKDLEISTHKDIANNEHRKE